MTTALAPALAGHAPLQRIRPSGWTVAVTAAAHAAIGLAYGIALRGWMRLVAEDPSFTWSGTLFIVGAFTIAFGACGVVAGGRRRGWRGLLVPVRSLALVACLPCFGAAGAAMFPTVVPGALALARSDWPSWARRALGVVAFLGTFALLGAGGDELGRGRVLIAWVLYCGLVLVEIKVFAEPLRPSVRRLPFGVRVATAVAGALTVGAAVALVAGMLVG